MTIRQTRDHRNINFGNSHHLAHPPHQRSNDDVHLGLRDNFTFGAALAARIHFPSNRPERSANDSQDDNTNQETKFSPARHRRHSKPDRNHKSKQRNGPQRYQCSPIPPQQPLLGSPKNSKLEHPDVYVENYRHDKELCDTARQYTHNTGQFYLQHDVFEWWFRRIIDRLDRKEFGSIELDPHEIVLDKLSDIYQSEEKHEGGNLMESSDFGVALVNYYAENMVPNSGFTVDQVEQARRDPNRWERRDVRELRWAGQDTTGEIENKWRTEHVLAARRHWEKIKQEKVERESDQQFRTFRAFKNKKSVDRRKDNKEKGFTGAKFDTRHRIGKGNGSTRRNPGSK